MKNELNSLDEVREKLGHFRISPLAHRIVQVAKNDRAPVQSLGEIITGEPFLAVRLLKLANLMSGLPQTLSTVPQSISILGLDQLKALTQGLSLFLWAPSSSTEEGGEREHGSLERRQLWEHSVGCATLAARMAVNVGAVSPPFAFVAGFLHDIGRVVLCRCAKDRFVESMAVAAEKHIPLTEAETLASGLNHQELGEFWSSKVELPESLRQVIRFHHEPPCALPAFVPDDVRKAIALVRLADLACESVAIGNGGERADGVEELWKTCDLRPEEWTDELHIIKQEIESSREAFGFRSEEPRNAHPLRRPVVAAEEGSVEHQQKIATQGRRGQIIPFPARGDHLPGDTETRASKRLTILVVEDHGSLCEMLSLYLMRYGYHVRTADNGQAALDLLAKEDIDLILLDLMLPRIDGFAVLKHVRETRAKQRPYIIVVSAGASERDRNKVLELGANEYMPKPFHLMRLLERIQAVEKYLLN